MTTVRVLLKVFPVLVLGSKKFLHTIKTVDKKRGISSLETFYSITAAMNQGQLEKGEKRSIAEDALTENTKKPKLENENFLKDITVDEQHESEDVASESPKQRFKKMALLLSYSGKGYLGMQRNPGVKTIEEDLFEAMHKAGLILQAHIDRPQQINFQRAARTDKGVSAVRQIVSLKLPVTEKPDRIVEKINDHLPPQIRVISIKRTTKGFNSKISCDARTYAYMLPTFAFAPPDVLTKEDYTIPSEKIKQLNDLLALYKGTHNYHNFTSGRKPEDESSKRYILSCECGMPFVREGIEFAIIKIKGQSFMLHQIRKMVGLSIAIMRGLANTETLKKAWSPQRIDIPIAPALGLMLEEIHYDKYNKKYGGDGIHEALSWEEYQPIIHKFKEDFIYPTIIETEKTEKSMFSWLETLVLHTYDIREDGPPEVKPPPSPYVSVLMQIRKIEENEPRNGEVS
ncbi:pseudouridylate synthase 1 homolog isoform X2 [Tachypleus tridentatus]|uniref:pseudouridylate synthase 1 homolog isoform X2 n=1 Tax=Tachypleus tridentatus TaxID=6853 RepID=UPI003FD1EC39